MNAQAPVHSLITAGRVNGAAVLNPGGERIGQIEDLSIDKVSGKVTYALLSFGGFLGLGERYFPLPWSQLHYDREREGYVVPIEKEALKEAPSLTREDLEAFGAGESVFSELEDYYGRFGATPGF